MSDRPSPTRLRRPQANDCIDADVLNTERRFYYQRGECRFPFGYYWNVFEEDGMFPMDTFCTEKAARTAIIAYTNGKPTPQDQYKHAIRRRYV